MKCFDLVAILNDANATRPTSGTAGLHHVAFAFATLRGLLEAWKLRKELGIIPTWSVNHGLATSIYYKDPDGNEIETQVDNFATLEEANEFMVSKFFQENPIGTDVNPEELLGRLEAGEEEELLKKRVEIGVRQDIPAGV